MSYASHNPYAGKTYQAVGFRPRPSNAMGVAGLIISILALIFTCGLLSPIGLLLSLIGLFRRPRGEAIAGTIIGGIGTLAVVSVLAFVVLVSSSAVNAARHAESRKITHQAMAAAELDVEEFRFQHGSLPAGIEGNKIVLQHHDGWDTSLRFEPDGDLYRIRSAGPDREFDTRDDILTGRADGPDHDSHEEASESLEFEFD
jgi:hypothetical protein